MKFTWYRSITTWLYVLGSFGDPGRPMSFISTCSVTRPLSWNRVGLRPCFPVAGSVNFT
jgi:hypothetical protein